MGMAIGICGTPRQAARYRRDGFDFYEATVRELCCPLADEAEFARRWRAADDGSLPCAGARGLLPPGLKICGPVASRPALRAYVGAVLRRAGAAGARTVICDSGPARSAPPGADRGRAWDELVAFASDAARQARACQVAIAMEPGEAPGDLLPTLAACAALARAVAMPELGVAVDAGRWLRDGGEVGELMAVMPMLRHVHLPAALAAGDGGAAARLDEFFRLLRRAGYRGGVSCAGARGGQAANAALVGRLRRWAA